MLKYLKLLPYALIVSLSLALVVVWYWPDTTPNYYSNTPRKPHVALQSPIVKGVERQVEGHKIAVLKPTEKQKGTISKKLGEPLPEAPIFGAFDIPCPPDSVGETAVVYLPEDGGEVAIKLYPKKVPFFASLLRERSLGLWAGIKEEAGMTGEIYRAEIEQGLLRTGPLRWGMRAAYEINPDVVSGWEVMIGARVKF